MITTKTELTDDQIALIYDVACELMYEVDERIKEDKELDLITERIETASDYAFYNNWSEEQESELCRQMGI